MADALTLSIFTLALALFAWSKGRADAIKDFRTHLGDVGDEAGRTGHPYRDYWHFLDQTRTISAFVAGGCFFLEIVLGSWILPIIYLSVLAPIYKSLIFDSEYYEDPKRLYLLDETIKISTGSKRLDKFFGYHH